MLSRIFGRSAKQLEHTIINFGSTTENPLERILVGSDQDIGGFSTAELDIMEESTANDSNDPAALHKFGRFHGTLNLDLPPSRPDVVQSGYAMFRTRELASSWLGLRSSEYWDWEDCTHLLLRVRGDRRKYFVNIQAETPFPTDIYQHRLFLKVPGCWETVAVPLHDFILTNWGVIQQQSPMDTRYIKTVGIGLIDKQYGPFSLDVDWIKVVGGEALSKLLKDRERDVNTGKMQVTPGKRLSIND